MLLGTTKMEINTYSSAGKGLSNSAVERHSNG
jgi:hypothetical protein